MGAISRDGPHLACFGLELQKYTFVQLIQSTHIDLYQGLLLCVLATILCVCMLACFLITSYAAWLAFWKDSDIQQNEKWLWICHDGQHYDLWVSWVKGGLRIQHETWCCGSGTSRAERNVTLSVFFDFWIVICPPGTFSAKYDTICTLCAAGSYNEKYSQEACKNCPGAESSNRKGAVSKGNCHSKLFLCCYMYYKNNYLNFYFSNNKA